MNENYKGKKYQRPQHKFYVESSNMGTFTSDNSPFLIELGSIVYTSVNILCTEARKALIFYQNLRI